MHVYLEHDGQLLSQFHQAALELLVELVLYLFLLLQEILAGLHQLLHQCLHLTSNCNVYGILESYSNLVTL